MESLFFSFANVFFTLTLLIISLDGEEHERSSAPIRSVKERKSGEKQGKAGAFFVLFVFPLYLASLSF